MKQAGLSAAMEMTRQSKRRARGLLEQGSNRIWLILAISLWIVSAGAIYLTGAGLIYAADDSVFTGEPSMLAVGLTLLSYALMLVLAIALLLPMAGGVMLLARYVYEGREIQAADLFAAFGSPLQYLRCMRLGLRGLACPVLTVVAAVLGCLTLPSTVAWAVTAAIETVAGEESAMYVLSWLAYAGTLLTGMALTLLILFLYRNAHLTSAYMARGMGWREARRCTKELLAENGCGSVYYRLSFVGHVALAVVTVGVSAVAYSIPLALLSNQFACDFREIQQK